MVDAVYFIIDCIKSTWQALAVDVGGGVRLDLVIIFLIIVSMFATMWFKGAQG